MYGSYYRPNTKIHLPTSSTAFQNHQITIHSKAMAAIRVTSTPASDGSSVKRKSSRWERWTDAVHDFHPSHSGTYSVKRLQALRDYCTQTSYLRVFCVCVAVPAPVLLIPIAIECIPLQDPLAGWRANTGTWIRLGLISFFNGVSIIAQMNGLVPMSRMPMWEKALVAVLCALLCPVS